MVILEGDILKCRLYCGNIIPWRKLGLDKDIARYDLRPNQDNYQRLAFDTFHICPNIKKRPLIKYMSKSIKVILVSISIISLGYVVFMIQKPDVPKEEIKTDGQNPTNDAANIQPETKTPESNNNNLTPIVENDGKAVDTSDWRTYRNEEYGFKIKYPEEFSSWEANYSQENAELIDVGFRPEDLQGSVLVITVLDIPLQELSTYEHSLYGDPTNDKVKIGDLFGVEFSGYRPRMIGIQKGKYTFFFKSLNWRNEKDLKYFDEMLSTFKFNKP